MLPITITSSRIVQMCDEVSELLEAKGFLRGLIDDPYYLDKLAVLGATEVMEAAQEYKRKGMSDGREAIATEIAGTAVRAFNYWPVHGKSFSTSDATIIRNFAEKTTHVASNPDSAIISSKFRNPWAALRYMTTLALDPNQWNNCALIGSCIVFSHLYLDMAFEDIFAAEMAKNWGRPVQYNLAKEHKR